MFDNIEVYIFIGMLMLVLIILYYYYDQIKREKFIGEYQFPDCVYEKVKSTYPHLNDEQVEWVIRGLRDYFIICLKNRGQMISMPPQAVDVAWHEFILFTRQHEKFCRIGLYRFLHHTPAEAMASQEHAQMGIKCAWYGACKRQGVSPLKPLSIPLLFAIDSDLKIPDGFEYSLDSSKEDTDRYWAFNIKCIGGDGGCSGG